MSYPDKGVYRHRRGFRVTVRDRDGKQHVRYFSKVKHGDSMLEALLAARAWRKLTRRKLGVPDTDQVVRFHGAKKGRVGVRRTNQGKAGFWRAAMRVDGQTVTRAFSVARYGERGARRLATSARRRWERERLGRAIA